jgi:prepilin-type processing-associated H-X9-DG protein
MSHTSCFSEFIHGELQEGRLGRQANTGHFGWVFAIGSFPTRDEFTAACNNLPVPISAQFVSAVGSPWDRAWPGSNWYNHQLVPGSKSCFIMGTGEYAGGMYSAFSASSYHSGGVNVLFLDGNVQFISNSVELYVWRALGSRDGGEYSSW